MKKKIKNKKGAPVKDPKSVKKNRCVRASEYDIEWMKKTGYKSLQDFLDRSIFAEKLMEGE